MARYIIPLLLAISASGQPPALKPGLYAIFNTSEGVITAKLDEKYAPIAVKTFVGLAQGTLPWSDPNTHAWVRRPLYNGITFHRVVREEMIQSGDPTGLGTHNCGITIPDEFLPGIQFDRPGRLAMANTGKADSGGCQFFITDQAIRQWNNHYTIFGQVIDGQDVVARINRKPLNGEKPVVPIMLNSVIIRRVVR